jgi:rubrerythrin
VVLILNKTSGLIFGLARDNLIARVPGKEDLMQTDPRLIKIFEYALNQEETGKSFFEISLQRMAWGAAVSAFKRLIEEEGRHIAYIKRILEELKQGSLDSLAVEEETSVPQSNFFDDRAKSEFLQQCLEGSMVPDVTVFNTAWLIEKDLHEFYERMANQTTGKARNALKMLAQWEKGHELFFREYRDKLTEIYSKMPWGG